MESFYRLLIAALLFSVGTQTNAQVLARWDFESPTPISSMNPSTAPSSVSAGITAANATATGVTNASVTSPGSDGSGPCAVPTSPGFPGPCFAFSASGWPTRPMSGTGVLDPGKYYEYTITANPGCTFRPTGLQVSQRSEGISPADPAYFQYRTSFDGFTTSLNRGTFGPAYASDVNFSGGTNSASGNTSPPAPWGVAGQTSLTVRVYYYHLPTPTSTTRMDMVRILGAVVCPNAMPVEFESFEGKAAGNRVQLSWATSWERNADRFEVERSQDATEFGAIGQVKAAGDATQKHVYGFTDEQALTGINYYRLRQVDRDGSVQFSKIIAVTTRPEAPAIAVLGNPIEGGRINLQLFNLEASKLRLTDMQGRSVAFRITESAGGMVTLEPASPLSNGMYLVGAAKVPAVKIVVR